LGSNNFIFCFEMDILYFLVNSKKINLNL
jgi:hypothetical protein